MRFNGTSWVAVGAAGIGMTNTNTVYNDFTSISIRNNYLSIELDASSNVYVAAVEYVNSGTRQASVYKFNGTSWTTLPSVGTSSGIDVDVAIDPVSSQPYLTYTSTSQGPITVKKYDGTSWTAVGSGFTGIAVNCKIDFSNNKPVVAYWNKGSGYKLDIFEFDGTTWNFVGGTVRPTADSYVSCELGIDASGNKYLGGMRQSSGLKFEVFKYCTSKPSITISPVTICGPDVAVLSATVSPSNVVINWFSTATSTTVLGNGISFTTPTLSTHTSYFAEADNKGCASTRGSSLITVKVTPEITAAAATPICGTSGTSTLTATATSGATITWYPIANAGLASGTGSPYTTTVLTSNRNYYAEATLNGCKSSPRTLVTATVQTAVPSITSTSPGVVCGTGSTQLKATTNNGTISWYATPTSTTALGTGTSFTTNISANTTYYVESVNALCKSTRVAVLAETNSIIPTLSNLVTGPTRCDTGSVAMSAATNYGYVQWYNNGGSVLLDTGNTFNSPDITANTPFYVRAFYKGCTSAYQYAYANVVIPPAITSTTPASICQGQSLAQISATSTGGGSIIWYADSLTTTILFSSSQGVLTITPTPTTTKKYFVQGSRSGCDNGKRIPVILTVKPLPTITSTTPAAICGSGTVSLNATSTAGTSINWYLSSTDVVPTATATNAFTTPNLTASKTYYLLPSSLNGCSTTVRTPITATINAIPSSVVTLTGNTLTASETGATYQWKDCNTSANISGATAQSYNVTANGNYKVTITKNTCSVTSNCNNFAVTSIEDEPLNENATKISPNPSDGNFVIISKESTNASIHNSQGAIVANINLQKGENEIKLDLTSGMYFININNQTSKLIIK
jgi:hypothetical protein